MANLLALVCKSGEFQQIQSADSLLAPRLQLGTNTAAYELHVNLASTGAVRAVFGDAVDSTTGGLAGHQIQRYSDGSLYLDYKTVNGGSINFRCGSNTDRGDARNWMNVSPSNANMTFYGTFTIAPPSGDLQFVGKIPATSNYAQFGFQNPSGSQRGFLGYIGSTFGAPRSDHFEMGSASGTNIYFRPGDSANLVTMYSSGGVGLGSSITDPGAGNIGLVAIPTIALATSLAGLLIGNANFVADNSVAVGTTLVISQNAIKDATNLKYISTDAASRYIQTGGTHEFFIYPSGTAGAALTGAISGLKLITNGSAIFGAAIRLKSYTVATLLASPVQGDTALVTDALAPTFGATVVGSGAVKVPVYYDGTNWKVG